VLYDQSKQTLSFKPFLHPDLAPLLPFGTEGDKNLEPPLNESAAVPGWFERCKVFDYFTQDEPIQLF
jgi:hypothetical protein